MRISPAHPYFFNSDSTRNFRGLQKDEAFRSYVDRFLQELNTTFYVMHRRIFQPAWNISMVARLRRNQATTDRQKGEYDVCMLTQAYAEEFEVKAAKDQRKSKRYSK